MRTFGFGIFNFSDCSFPSTWTKIKKKKREEKKGIIRISGRASSRTALTAQYLPLPTPVGEPNSCLHKYCHSGFK